MCHLSVSIRFCPIFLYICPGNSSPLSMCQKLKCVYFHIFLDSPNNLFVCHDSAYNYCIEHLMDGQLKNNFKFTQIVSIFYYTCTTHHTHTHLRLRGKNMQLFHDWPIILTRVEFMTHRHSLPSKNRFQCFFAVKQTTNHLIIAHMNPLRISRYVLYWAYVSYALELFIGGYI